jgi:hypothetical protein
MVLLQLERRTSADGAATSYTAFVERPRMGLEPKGWRLVRRKHCCDEHASREDRLFEHVWSRSTARLRAVVSVVEFEERLRDPQMVAGATCSSKPRAPRLTIVWPPIPERSVSSLCIPPKARYEVACPGWAK